MSDTNKFILLFFILNLNCVTFSIWAMFYPYYASYVKPAIPSMTMKEMFAYTIFQYFGYTIGSSFMNLTLFLFGYKSSLMIIGVLNFLHCALGVIYVNKFTVILSVGFTGLIRQCISVLTILFFTERHREKAALYYSKPLGGTALGSFIWAIVLNYMVNPNNEDLSVLIEENGQVNKYYSYDVASNVYQFYMVHGLIALGTFVVVYFYIPQSEKFTGKLFEVLSIIKSRNGSINQSYQSFKSMYNESMASGDKNLNGVMMPVGNSRFCNESVNSSKKSFKSENSMKTQRGSKNLNENLIQNIELPEKPITEDRPAGNIDNETGEEIIALEAEDNSIKGEVLSLHFWVIFVISIIRNSETAFMVDNYKLQGMEIVRNDKLLNQAYALSGIAQLFVRSYAGTIWEKLGFLDSYTVAIMGSFFLDFLYLTFIDKLPTLFLLTTIFARCLYGFNNIMNYLTLYTIYPAEKALRLSIVYDFHFFISIVLTIFFNSYFVDNMNFKPVYGTYLALDIIALVLLFLFIRPWIGGGRINY